VSAAHGRWLFRGIKVEVSVIDSETGDAQRPVSPSESRNYMPDMKEVAVRHPEPKQAAELAQLVELEARWENLRRDSSRAKDGGSVTRTLLGMQRAYEDFHSRLVAYNKQYTPPYTPESLLNTPSRLATWCRAMRAVYLVVEHDPHIQSPVHLLEKAYRWAERMSVRIGVGPVSRSAPPDSIRAAVDKLETLVQWCDDLAEDRGKNPTS
jgi:hypothetical protein